MKTKCQICGKEFPNERKAEEHEYAAHFALPHDSEPDATMNDKPPSVPLQQVVRQIDVQNALRLLCRVSRQDEEMVFVGNDMILFRKHLYRTQEVAEMLMPNPAHLARTTPEDRT